MPVFKRASTTRFCHGLPSEWRCRALPSQASPGGPPQTATGAEVDAGPLATHLAGGVLGLLLIPVEGWSCGGRGAGIQFFNVPEKPLKRLKKSLKI